MIQSDWIVIGAGVSGARLTHHLSTAGFQVTVLEKSRGLGGRLCHRRSEHGRFLHGLQYVHLRDPRSQAIMAPWLQAPHAHRLGPLGFCAIDGSIDAANKAARFQFFPETSTFCRVWTERASVYRQTRVTSLDFDGRQWTVTTDEQVFTAPYLASSIPFTQLLELVPPDFHAQLKQDHSIAEAPSCSVMFRTHSPRHLPNDWQGMFFEADSDGPVRFLLSQPSNQTLHWTAILAAEWVETHWKTEHPNVLDPIYQQLSQVFTTDFSEVDIEWFNIHWWKYAFSTPTNKPIQHYPDWHFIMVGDGVGNQGKGFEGALISVESIAKTAIEMAQT